MNKNPTPLDYNENNKPKGFFKRTKEEIELGLTASDAKKRRKEQQQKQLME